MKIKKISLKLYIVCFILFFCVLIIQFVVGNMLLPSIYTGVKKKNLKRELDSVTNRIVGSKISDIESIARLINSNNIGSNIIVDGNNSIVVNDTKDGISFKIVPRTLIEKIITERDDVEEQIGDSIKSILEGQNNTISDAGINSVVEGALWNQIDTISENRVEFEWFNGKTKEKQYSIVRSVGKRESYLLIGTTSLENIEDAVQVLGVLNFVIFLVSAVILAICLFMITKKISEPLVQMSKVSKNMSKLDFSQKCKVTTEDEVGILGKNLNHMSEQLQGNIHELNIANEKLLEELKNKEKQVELRKEFFANISHELKTPLTIMSGTVSGIKDGIYHADKEAMDSLDEEIKYMRKLVYEIMDIAIIEQEESPREEQVFSLSDVVLKIHNKFKKICIDKKILMNIIYDDIFIKANKSMIEQVVLNFYSNAVRYTPEGGRIVVKIKDGQEGEFSIFNSGAMIPKEAMEDIWKPFYRVEKSRNRNSGGTGLGLHIVKKILDLHKMSFNIENIGDGVEFRFKFKKIQELE